LFYTQLHLKLNQATAAGRPLRVQGHLSGRRQRAINRQPPAGLHP